MSDNEYEDDFERSGDFEVCISELLQANCDTRNA